MRISLVMSLLMRCFCSVVGQMSNSTHGFGERVGGGDLSMKLGLSVETVTREKKGERRGSPVKKLFRRKGSDDKGKQ